MTSVRPVTLNHSSADRLKVMLVLGTALNLSVDSLSRKRTVTERKSPVKSVLSAICEKRQILG